MIHIKLAAHEDAEEIAALYRSLIGTEGCIWNEEYPDIGFVRDDIENKSLYKAVEDGGMIAAAYLGDYEEIERAECIDKSFKRLGEFARVAVKREYHHRGIAEELLKFLQGEARIRGYDGISLLVAPENRAAVGLYEKIGFKKCGEVHYYELDWYCYQYRV